MRHTRITASLRSGFFKNKNDQSRCVAVGARLKGRFVAAFPGAKVGETPSAIVALEAIQVSDQFGALIEGDGAREEFLSPECDDFVDEGLRFVMAVQIAAQRG